MSGITMQVSFTSVISPLPSSAERRCCAKLQRGDVQCPNKAKFVFDNEFYFCGVHLKPTSESVTRMSSPIMHQTKFGDKPTTVVSSVPSVSVPSVVPDLSSIERLTNENKEIKQQLQQLQQLYRLVELQQETIRLMGIQIQSLVDSRKVESEEKEDQEDQED